MSMLLSKVMKRVVIGTFAVVGSVAFAQNVPVGKASEAAFKIELGNLLKIPVGNTLVHIGINQHEPCVKCYNVHMPIRRHIAILLTAVAAVVLARTLTVSLPPVAHADTETVANMPMPSVDMATRRVSFSLAFAATPSNCVEAVFGTDIDGDGELSPGERRLAVGWRCGRWFVRKSPDSESSVYIPMVADGSETELSWKMRLSPVGAIESLEASVDGSPVFTTLSAAPPPWLHDPAWNMVRLRGCGKGVLGETFSVATSADGTTFFFR